MGKTLQFLLGCLLFVLTIFIAAVVMVDMWGWFVVPLGVPAIGLAHAAGFSLLISWRAHNPHSSTEKKWISQMLTNILSTLLVWPFGWFFKELM